MRVCVCVCVRAYVRALMYICRIHIVGKDNTHPQVGVCHHLYTGGAGEEKI